MGAWIARYLGPETFGLLNYSIAFIAFFSWMSNLVIDNIAVKELVKNPEDANKILGTTFFIKFWGSLLSIVLILFAIYTVKPANTELHLIVFILSFSYLFQAFDVVSYLYEAKVLSKNIIIIKITALIIALAVKIILILAEFSVEYFAITTVFEMAIISIMLALFYNKKHSSPLQWKFDKLIAIRLLNYSWPLTISMFLISIHSKIDQIMIENFLSMPDVGFYSVAVILSSSWYFIPTIITSTLMPYYINIREKKPDLYLLRLMQLFSFMFWLSVMIGLVIIFYGKDLIIFLFGIEYQRAYGVLIFNIWGGIFIAQGSVASIWQIIENLQLYRLYVQIISVFINIGLNLLLIKEYGISGAAMATFLTYFIATWLLPLAFKEVRPISVMMIKSVNIMYFVQLIKEKKNEKFL